MARVLLVSSIALRYDWPVKQTGSLNDRIALPLDAWARTELRHHIRRFRRVREEAPHAAGVEPQQYLLLLQVKSMQEALARRGP